MAISLFLLSRQPNSHGYQGANGDKAQRVGSVPVDACQAVAIMRKNGCHRH